MWEKEPWTKYFCTVDEKKNHPMLVWLSKFKDVQNDILTSSASFARISFGMGAKYNYKGNVMQFAPIMCYVGQMACLMACFIH